MWFRLLRRQSAFGRWDMWRELTLDELRDEETVDLVFKLCILRPDIPLANLQWELDTGVAWRLERVP